MTEDDRSPLLGVRKNRFRGTEVENEDLDVEIHCQHDNGRRIYFSRYWMLFLTCLALFFHCVEWNTWGPITESIQHEFGWNEGSIALLAGWGPIMYVLCVGPVCWAAQNIGLRYSMIFSGLVTAVGMSLRCIPLSDKLFTMICHLASVLLGIGSTAVLAVPPMVAADWFAPHERTTAISIMMASSILGSIASYLEPLLVRAPGHGTSDDIRKDISILMYIGCGGSVVIFLCLLIYFPSKPPSCPSNASEANRISFKSSIKALFSSRNLNVWALIICYGIAVGPSIAWITTLDVSLLPLGIGQRESMWIGISAVISSAIVGVITGKITDMIFGYLKITILILLLVSAAFYYWFYLISAGFIGLSNGKYIHQYLEQWPSTMQH